MKLAVIPARGGSKRIPRKNIKSFAGKPIIAYPIEAALTSDIFDQVVVSTEDDEIASLSRALGASVPFIRPQELASDSARGFSAVAHAIRHFEAEGMELSQVCCVYATNPFIRVTDLLAGYDLISEGVYDFVIAATTYDFPVYRSLRELDNQLVEPVFPDRINRRSQEIPEFMHDCGQFYWGCPRSFHAYDTVFAHPKVTVGSVRIPRHLVHDIDTEEDWTRAELVHRALFAN